MWLEFNRIKDCPGTTLTTNVDGDMVTETLINSIDDITIANRITNWKTKLVIETIFLAGDKAQTAVFNLVETPIGYIQKEVRLR